MCKACLASLPMRRPEKRVIMLKRLIQNKKLDAVKLSVKSSSAPNEPSLIDLFQTVEPTVGKFHLSNGVTLHQFNCAEDFHQQGLHQSGGIMVN